jgi:DNA invertase Pin-like site-specific DNA recombinase
MRCSTDRQDMALQEDALKEAGCDKIFSDVMSGAKTERPGLTECLKFLQKGDTLVTWKLDRVGRNLRHLVNVVHDLNDRGVGFKVLTGQGASIDTTTPAGKLIFGIFASLAEFERELIRERVNAGIKAAKARGVKFGRDTIITSEMIEATKGRSVRAVAKQYGVSKSALYQGAKRAPASHPSQTG